MGEGPAGCPIDADTAEAVGDERRVGGSDVAASAADVCSLPFHGRSAEGVVPGLPSDERQAEGVAPSLPSDERPAAAAVRLPLGPYAGLTVEQVAVIDPDYLLDLVREEVGSATLRAAAARALACRGRLVRRAEAVAGGERGRPGRAAPAVPDEGGWQGWSSPDLRPARATPRPAMSGQPGGGWRAARLWLGRWWGALVAVGLIALLGTGIAGSLRARGSAGPALGLVGRSEDISTPDSWMVRPDPTRRPMTGRERSVPEPGLGFAALPAQQAAAEGMATPALTGTVASERLAAEDGSAAQAARPSTRCGQRSAGAITAAAAQSYVDTFQAVEFEVVRTKDTGRVTYLNSHDPYQGHFYVAVFPGDYEKFHLPPAVLFRGKCIVVQGVIEMYRGTPQIVLHSPEDVRILADP